MNSHTKVCNIRDRMNSLNAKRITAIAASLAMGLVFAGPVSFSNIPIINSAGQPVVQVVVGSSAQPSDGVVAANIAAVIGNLAYTTTPITATVGNTNAVSCTVTTPSCTLSDQQVWLGEKGTVSAAGSYNLKALIGSVLNGATLNAGTLGASKATQSGTSNQYSYPQTNSPFAITSTPAATSAFAGYGALGVNSSVVSSTNGGGITFSQLSVFSGAQYFDNVVQLTSSQVPGLLTNSGSYQETESLWLEGFPVYDQAAGIQNFAILDAAGAYQVTFGKPVPIYTNITNYNSGQVNHGIINILGQQWSMFQANAPTISANQPTSSNFVVGGSILLSQAQTPLTTIYVGHNISAGGVTVALQDLSYPNSNGISSASVQIYKNGVALNQTSIAPGVTQLVNASGTKIYVYVQSTFPGLYAYQKWAKIQLFTNVFNVTSGGKPFNVSNKQWNAILRWTTNQTSQLVGASGFSSNAQLQGITIYQNTTRSAATLLAGQSINFITNPAVWKMTFVGDSLGAPGSGNTNYDSLGFTTGSGTRTYSNPAQTGLSTTVPSVAWANNGLIFTPTNVLAGSNTVALTSTAVNATSMTEPVNLFSVTSAVPSAFTVTSATAQPNPTSSISSLNYSLDTFQLIPQNNVNSLSLAGSALNVVNAGIIVNVINSGVVATNGNYVSTAHPLTVAVQGYKGGVLQSPVTFSFTSFGGQTQAGTLFDNVTSIQLGYAVPNGVKVQVYESPSIASGVPGTNSELLSVLSYNGPYLLYSVPQHTNYLISQPANVGQSGAVSTQYNVEGTLLPFSLVSTIGGSLGPSNSGRNQYFTYNVPLITNPQAPTTANAFLYVGITNSSTILSSPMYWLNKTNGQAGSSVQYISSQGNSVNATSGFRTERGDMVSSVGTQSVSLNIAKSIDTLALLVGPASSTVATSTANFGPYGVGQATNIANVTIANVTAQCTFSSTSCSVTGLSNLTATPSVASAVTSVGLNTATTPIAVLDSSSSAASTLVVIGSKFVNSVAGQIFAQNPSLDSSFGTSSVVVQAFGTNRILVAGYSANQTVSAGNQFIQALLASAASGQ